MTEVSGLLGNGRLYRAEHNGWTSCEILNELSADVANSCKKLL